MVTDPAHYAGLAEKRRARGPAPPTGRIFRIEVGQQANEFHAAAAVFHTRRDVTILEIQRCQDGTGAVSRIRDRG
jgi:hypothetical protein